MAADQPRTGSGPARAWQWIVDHPPPGPFRATRWRSPIRGPWLTSVLGAVLLVGMPVLLLTGLASYVAYNPELGTGGNDMTPEAGLLADYVFAWPTEVPWLYRLNQGLHVIGGLVLVPVILAKLWSVIPKFFGWPPTRSVAQTLERVSLLFLVGGLIFEFATGIINIYYWYEFPASFYRLHFYGAWVFGGAFVVHVALKLGTMRRSLRARPLRRELRVGLAGTEPEEPDVTGLVAPEPARPTISRRGALGVVAAGSGLTFLFTAGSNLGGAFRRIALLSPRGQPVGEGPNDFQVNKTAAYRGITEEQTGASWRLELEGASAVSLSRTDLEAMDQHTFDLAIACVEGWSTGVQRWSGVRLADLARLAGAQEASRVRVSSLQQGGAFGSALLSGDEIRDPNSLLALRVNDAELSLDHGFPARVIVPANPGVHQTKWVSTMSFEI